MYTYELHKHITYKDTIITEHTTPLSLGDMNAAIQHGTQIAGAEGADTDKVLYQSQDDDKALLYFASAQAEAGFSLLVKAQQ